MFVYAQNIRYPRSPRSTLAQRFGLYSAIRPILGQSSAQGIAPSRKQATLDLIGVFALTTAMCLPSIWA